MPKRLDTAPAPLTRERVLEAVRKAGAGAHKSDIARELGIGPDQKKELRHILRELEESGALGRSGRRSYTDAQALPQSGVMDVIDHDPDGELLARMRVALRHFRSRTEGVSVEPVVEAGDIVIDLARRSVSKRGEPVHLSPIEFNLLAFLAKHAGKVVTHRQILADVWGDEYSEESQYLRVYIGYLRKKLEDDPAKPSLLLTEPRIGYRLQA